MPDQTLTTDEWLARARKVHGDRFDYSRVAYTGYRIKVEVVCREHGPFWQRAGNHLRGYGCPRCAFEGRQQSQETFVAHATARHGGRYDYSRVVYTGFRSKIEVVCPEHGSFWPQAGQHSQGYGCPQCAIEGRRLSQETFVATASAKHEGRYDYSQTRYSGMDRAVDIICPAHGHFIQKAINHVSGSGCPACSREHLSRTRRANSDDFVRAARRVHGDIYDYSRAEYSGSKTPVEIICRVHGAFRQMPEVHVRRGCGCPRCSRENGPPVKHRVIRNTVQFVKAARRVHGDRFTYERARFTLLGDPITATCPTHGDMTIIAALHLRNAPAGCAPCAPATVKRTRH